MHLYKYIPYSITGKIFPATSENLAEVYVSSGESKGHVCNVCQAIFQISSSLRKHISRQHNPNLTVQCPVCPKKLSHKAAIRKHLLSHAPRSTWPYQCPFCLKRFQAKGDLPKHFLTRIHRDDPRIPDHMSEGWIELFKNCKVPPNQENPIKMEDPPKISSTYEVPLRETLDFALSNSLSNSQILQPVRSNLSTNSSIEYKSGPQSDTVSTVSPTSLCGRPDLESSKDSPERAKVSNFIVILHGPQMSFPNKIILNGQPLPTSSSSTTPEFLTTLVHNRGQPVQQHSQPLSNIPAKEPWAFNTLECNPCTDDIDLSIVKQEPTW